MYFSFIIFIAIIIQVTHVAEFPSYVRQYGRPWAEKEKQKSDMNSLF
jgi:hypothetical protein